MLLSFRSLMLRPRPRRPPSSAPCCAGLGAGGGFWGCAFWGCGFCGWAFWGCEFWGCALCVTGSWTRSPLDWPFGVSTAAALSAGDRPDVRLLVGMGLLALWA